MADDVIFNQLPEPPVRAEDGTLDTRVGFRDGSRPTGPQPPVFTVTATSSSLTAVIQGSNGATSYNIRVNGGAAVSGLTVSGLQANTQYSVEVQGINAEGTGDWSDPVLHSTTESLPEGSLIFEIDYSQQQPWAVQHKNQRYIYEGYTGEDGSSGYVAGDNLPPGFDFMYPSEAWHPNGDKHGNNAFPGQQPVMQISNLHGNMNDPNGNSWIMYDESEGGPGQWGSDSVMTKDLGQEYPELHFVVWVRFQPDWQWHAQQVPLGSSDQGAMKFLRCRRMTGEASPNRFDFYGREARQGSPVCIFDPKIWVKRDGFQSARHQVSLRGYSSLQDYDNGIDYFHFFDRAEYPTVEDQPIRDAQGNLMTIAQVYNTGQWHKYELHVKMDSSPGARDGVCETWWDGLKVIDLHNIPWRRVGDLHPIGWNEISLGGNMDNLWAPEAEQAEQWYQVHSFHLYTSRPVN